MERQNEKTPEVRIQELEKQVRFLWAVIAGQYLGEVLWLISHFKF